MKIRSLIALALITLLLCLAASGLAEAIDEALMPEETIPVAPIPAEDSDPDAVYAHSDATESTGETLIEEGARPEFVTRLLEIAREELGYTEGPNNHTKYGEWSGDPNAAWCAEFVCWCVNQVDQRFGTTLLNTVYPNYSGQNTGRDWFLKRGRFVYRKGICPDWGRQWERGADHELEKNEFIPRSGDWVFFSYNEAGDTEHVAMIEYTARDDQGRVVLHVIEGNNPSAVQRNQYYLNNSQILGFGLCEDVVDTAIRLNCRGDKVTVLQQRLNALGYLASRHITGACGSNTRAAYTAFQKDYLPEEPLTGVAGRKLQQAIEEQYMRLVFDEADTWLVEE